MNRSAAREQAFGLIYSFEIQKENVQEQIDLYIENQDIADKNTKQYIAQIAKGIENHVANIEEKITQNLKKDWTIQRVSKMDIALLKLAIYEILYTETPYKVVINEAVELAKKYGDATSPNFINGMLASIVKESGKVE